MGEFDKYKDFDNQNQPADLFYEDETVEPELHEEKSASNVDDEFVIGGGFDLSRDYEGQIRSRRSMDELPVKPHPLSKRDEVDLKRISRDEKRNKKRSNGKSPLRTLIYVAIILITAVVLAGGILIGFNEVLGIGKNDTCVVVVKQGMSTSAIADLLEEEGAINHPLMFRFYLKLKKQDGTLRHGAYQFNNSLGYDGIISLLQKGNEKESVSVRIPEGATINAICEIMEENKVCTAKQFKSAIKNGKYDYDFVKAIPEEKVYFLLEGYLYPDTYEFFTGETEENARFAIDRMLENFETKLNEACPDYEEKIKGMSEYGIKSLNDVLSLASIVELECNGYPNEMDNVAGVFLGRLIWTEPHYLGSTPTFYYPDNRYNTNNYELYDTNGKLISKAGYEGLPPGPQCSMTVDAIKAVLNPNTEYIGKYYYFVTDANSKFYYNATYKQHKDTITSLKNKGLWAG